MEEEARFETIALTVGGAAALGAAFWALRGPEIAGQYFAGYLLEQSLSVDNLFVFVLVFRCAGFGVFGFWRAVRRILSRASSLSTPPH